MDDKFAFLGVYGSAAGPTGLRGGVMVTDDAGIPLELRVAETVRADLLQRRAYGDTLQNHAVRDLISAPLLQSLEMRPSFALANNLQCLDAPAPFPLLFLADAETAAIVGEYVVKRVTHDESNLALLVTQAADADIEFLDTAVECIARFQKKFDPLGAFQRIEDVIAHLSGNDARFK